MKKLTKHLLSQTREKIFNKAFKHVDEQVKLEVSYRVVNNNPVLSGKESGSGTYFITENVSVILNRLYDAVHVV